MSKKILVSENQFNRLVKSNVLDEMAYPVAFSFEEFSKIKSFRGKIDYCNRLLTRLSSGSARVVYKVDDEKVLKIAKNNKGIAQNNVESDKYLQQYGCFAEIFNYDVNNLWIEMELASKARLSDFPKILGKSFDVLTSFVDYINFEYNNRRSRYFSRNTRYDDYFDKIMNDEDYDDPFFEFAIDLAYYLRDYTLEGVGDFKRINSYGIVKRNGKDKIVIIDYGINDEVYNDYYSR